MEKIIETYLKQHYAKLCDQSDPADFDSNLEAFADAHPVIDTSRHGLNEDWTLYGDEPIRPQDVRPSARDILSFDSESVVWQNDPAVKEMLSLIWTTSYPYDVPDRYIAGVGSGRLDDRFSKFSLEDHQHYWEYHSAHQIMPEREHRLYTAYQAWLKDGNCPPPRVSGPSDNQQTSLVEENSEQSSTIQTSKVFGMAALGLMATWGAWGLATFLLYDDFTGLGTLDDPLLLIVTPLAMRTSATTVAAVASLAASALLVFNF